MKTVFGTALTAMLFFSALHSPVPRVPSNAEATYSWTRALALGSGVWPEACSRPAPNARANPARYPGRCIDGGWPRAIVPVEFRGDIWMAQDANFAWRSPDGTRWSRRKTSGGREERYGAVPVVFRDRIWLLGGTTPDWKFRNDVWVSSNAVDWTRVTEHAEWSPRRWHAVVVFAGRLWLLGGSDQDPTNPGRGGARNDVWVSDNGKLWTQVTAQAPWSPRSGLRGLVFQDQLWVIGGTEQTDAWATRDGHGGHRSLPARAGRRGAPMGRKSSAASCGSLAGSTQLARATTYGFPPTARPGSNPLRLRGRHAPRSTAWSSASGCGFLVEKPGAATMPAMCGCWIGQAPPLIDRAKVRRR